MLPDFVTLHGFASQVAQATGWSKKPMTPARWNDVVLQLMAPPPLEAARTALFKAPRRRRGPKFCPRERARPGAQTCIEERCRRGGRGRGGRTHLPRPQRCSCFIQRPGVASMIPSCSIDTPFAKVNGQGCLEPAS